MRKGHYGGTRELPQGGERGERMSVCAGDVARHTVLLQPKASTQLVRHVCCVVEGRGGGEELHAVVLRNDIATVIDSAFGNNPRRHARRQLLLQI